MSVRSVTLLALDGLPLIGPTSDLSGEIGSALADAGLSLQDSDIVVVAQKVVSKAEARTVTLADVTPSARALELAHLTGKDPRFVEVVLSESTRVLRATMNVLIVEHRSGHVMANAGIDRSNVDDKAEAEETVLLLPEDPDRSAASLREKLEARSGAGIGVIVSDSFGRPWRLGTTGVAIGVSGPPALIDRRGDVDLFGRPLKVTEVAFADAVAAAATLVMGEGAEACPAVVVRGLDWPMTTQAAGDVLRPAAQDLFR